MRGDTLPPPIDVGVEVSLNKLIGNNPEIFGVENA
jgi:hypothetical protein